MRANVLLSTCKSSKQTQHVSASLCGCGLDDDPAEEDNDLEVELDLVDVVPFAMAVVSVSFNTLVSDSILVATAPVLRNVGWFYSLIQCLVFMGVKGGI